MLVRTRWLAWALVLAAWGCAPVEEGDDEAQSGASALGTPTNYPLARATEADPVLEIHNLYEDLRLKTAWASSTGAGFRVAAMDADFLLPPNSQNIGPSFQVSQVSRTFWTENTVAAYTPAQRAPAAQDRPHGTFVAQLAAGNDRGNVATNDIDWVGVAYDASITYFKVNPSTSWGMGDKGPGPMIAAALRHIAAQSDASKTIAAFVADPGINADTSQAQKVIDAIGDATAKGVVVVLPSIFFGNTMIAANSGWTKTVNALNEKALAKGAILAAPSPKSRDGSRNFTGIPSGVSAYVPTTNGYHSVATPVVAGVVTLMRAAKPSLTGAQIRAILTSISSSTAPLRADSAVSRALAGK